MSARGTTVPVVMLVVLVAPLIAGCAGPGEDGQEPATRFASFEEARDADGIRFDAEGSHTDLRARILAPLGFQALQTGSTEFVVLLYDPLEQAPALDATVGLETRDGGSVRLAEDGHGVYVGNLSVDGPGEVPAALTAVLADGSAVRFTLTLGAYGSASDAMSADGLVFQPVSGTDSLRLKLLSPDEPLDMPAGRHPLTFLLFDGKTGQAIDGADAELRSWMPPHGLPGGDQMQGHGTHSEIHPVHHRFGVYQGQMNIVMNGTWWTNVTVTLDDGSTARFTITFDAGEGSHSHGDDGHDDHSHAHAFTTFRQALAAHGPELEMSDLNGTATMTAKLLMPPADNASQGQQDVKILLHRSEADRPAPVPAGHAEMDIHKHAHDGGIVDANTSEIVHSGHGVWTATTNFTESGTWTIHVEVHSIEGRTFTGKFQVGVGQHTGGHEHDHGGHEH